MNKLLLLCCCSLLFACTKKSPASSAYIQPPIVTGPVRTWLALGDSYTIGQAVDPAERFPALASGMLKQNGINIGTPDYIATTGWTSISLSNAITAANPAKHDVVSLLIGVNDQYQTHDTTGYRQRFSVLLSKAIQLANGKSENVFVLSIPDYSVTPFASGRDTARIRLEIDWFNDINKTMAAFFNCPYLDITSSTREAKNDLSLLAYDGLHPSGKEYRRWAEKLTPMMLPVLK
ncbi:MAG: SGNH/GDSL hydrolase family protein [Chitinophagaceae bacterium]|nr:SGNH/GDSL hydrolase family protein [Chitinophagaceae bacterium]